MQALPIIMRRAFAACALLFITVPLLAANHVWLGAVSNRFSDPLNWAAGGAPVPGEEAELEFPAESERLNVVNDIAGLHVKSISNEADVELSGQPIAMTDALITGNGDLTIWNDIDVEGTLTLSTYSIVELKGALSGNGGVTLTAARVVFSGTRSNTYRGETVLDNSSALWLRKQNAIAVPGNLRTTNVQTNRIHQEAPEQIADSAIVTLTGGELFLRYDETIDTLRSGRTIFNDSGLFPTLIVGTLEPDAGLVIHAHVRFTRSSVTLPAGAFININGDVAVPANATFHIHGPGTIVYDAGYSAPTLVDGATANLSIPNSKVEMTSGVFNGTVASLTATGGRVEHVVSGGDVRFTSGVTLHYDGLDDFIQSGVLDLGNATLDVNPFVSGTQIVFRNGTAQLSGTFKGLPESAIVSNRYVISYKGGDGNDIVLGELPKPKALMSIATDPMPAVLGDPVTITVALTGSAGLPTGTVTFTLGGTELGVATIANGKASVTTRLTNALLASVTAQYSGDTAYASTSLATNIAIVYPRPTITAIEPATGKAGTKVPVTIRGTGFIADSKVFFGNAGPIAAQVISSSEIHATVDLTPFRHPASSGLTVAQGPSFYLSNQATFTITADPPPPSPIHFDDAATVSFATTKGSRTAWIAGVNDLTLATNFIIDSDNDGVVKWVWPTGRVPEVMIGAVDLSAGTFAFNGRDNADFGAVVLPWPKQSFARDASGAVRSFIIPAGRPWLVLWARPGVGAWRALIDDGSADDADGIFNNIIFANTAPFVAMGDSPSHPSSFAKGDIVIAYSRGFVPAPRSIYAGKLGDEIDEVVPGHIAMAALHTNVEEGDGVTHIPVIRTGGANGSATVHYRTLNGSAVGGYDFTPVADGVLTFAPGEVVKFIEVPLRNDNAYSPDRTFVVQLFNASGAALDGLEQSSVYLYDFDRPPIFDVVGSSLRIVFAGDKPTPIEIPLTLTGTFTQPVVIRWTATRLFDVTSGQIVFQPGESYKVLRLEIPAASELSGFGYEDLQVDFNSSIDINDFVVIHVETKPNAHVVPLAVSESAGVAHVAVTLDHPFTQRTNVECQTEDVSATSGADYTATNRTITFEAGQTQQTCDVPILNDSVADGDDTFEARAYFPTGEIAHALVTIVDDEVSVRPRLTIDDRVSISEGNGIASGSLTLRLSAASTLPVTVHMETIDGTAFGGYDYNQIYETVTFAPGETTKSIPVFVYGDTSKEPNETFFVTLDSATNATLDPPASRATVTIVDEDPTVPVRRRGLRH